MAEKKLCILCGVGRREIPDRNVMGRPIKKICRKCHSERLRGDMVKVLKANQLKGEDGK